MAIANGCHAVCGDDLSKISSSHTNENERASISGIENKLLAPFPVEYEARMEQTLKHINIEVSCECKRLGKYQNMIACDGCDRWAAHGVCWTK